MTWGSAGSGKKTVASWKKSERLLVALAPGIRR
jgi:hypothetical protein